MKIKSQIRKNLQESIQCCTSSPKTLHSYQFYADSLDPNLLSFEQYLWFLLTFCCIKYIVLSFVWRIFSLLWLHEDCCLPPNWWNQLCAEVFVHDIWVFSPFLMGKIDNHSFKMSFESQLAVKVVEWNHWIDETSDHNLIWKKLKVLKLLHASCFCYDLQCLQNPEEGANSAARNSKYFWKRYSM